jgi:ATP-binding protein involved in chromosome partitioning
LNWYVYSLAFTTSEFVAPDGSRHAVFGEGGGAALADETGVPLVARIPIEPAVSHGGDTGRPVAIDAPGIAAGIAFAELAARITDDLLPPIEMAGCTARLLTLVQQAGGTSPRAT